MWGKCRVKWEGEGNAGYSGKVGKMYVKWEGGEKCRVKWEGGGIGRVKWGKMGK
jgi:hypothetical protein